MQDFSPLLEDNALAWVQKEKDKREIELYNASLFDLKYVSYNYVLDYDSFEIKNNKATVQLRENHQVVFEAIAPQVSEMANLQHTFTLHNNKGMWVIYKDEYQDELSRAMNNKTKADIKKQVDENYQADLNQKSLMPSTENILSPVPNNLTLFNYSYNRSAATTYADLHVPHSGCGPSGCAYNTTYYKTEANDCANYVSQAMYAGEGKTPPDTSGMPGAGRDYNLDWYYVFNNPPGTQNGSGSLPWVQVQEQYDFIRFNGSRIGPYGYAGSFSNTQSGDVVQVDEGSGFLHEGMVIYKGTGLSTTLIDAHTIDRYHYPLSNWANYPLRYAIIQGWRGN